MRTAHASMPATHHTVSTLDVEKCMGSGFGANINLLTLDHDGPVELYALYQRQRPSMATAACTCTHTTGMTTADMAVTKNPVKEQMLYLRAWQDHQRSPSSGQNLSPTSGADACSEHLYIAGKVGGPVHRGSVLWQI